MYLRDRYAWNMRRELLRVLEIVRTGIVLSRLVLSRARAVLHSIFLPASPSLLGSVAVTIPFNIIVLILSSFLFLLLPHLTPLLYTPAASYQQR